jgi:predicted nucleic acid-binding protein
MSRILIDTRIWALGLKYPFIIPEDEDYKLAEKAHHLISIKLKGKRERVFISSQLAAEIFHVLTKRGRRLPETQAKSLLTEILLLENVSYRHIEKEVFLAAMGESSKSGIHIWDYLVFLPFKGEVRTIYTMDPHFNDKSFRDHTGIENPFGIWRSEGQK